MVGSRVMRGMGIKWFFRMNKWIVVGIQIKVEVSSLGLAVNIIPMIALKYLLVENSAIGA